jgi:plastocyanin
MHGKNSFFIFILILASIILASLAFSASYNSVRDIPANCTGNIITDSFSGTCRTIYCEGNTGSLQVLACDKPDSGTKQYFEMYKKTSSGSTPKICIGPTCMQNEGYVKSPNYPITFDSSPTNTTPPSNTTSPPANNTTNNSTSNNSSSNTCASHVNNLPLTCTSTITQDTKSGSCRTIVCGTSSNSIKVLACNKPDGSPEYFEMYKQSSSGSPPKVCLANTCIQSEGYKKSSNYPICFADTSPPVNNTTPPANTTNSTSPPTNNTNSTNNNTTNTCANKLSELQTTCKSGAKTDTLSGTCRTVQCTASSGSVTAQACEKTDSNGKYFEIYRQSSSGSAPEVCFGNTCLKSGWGYEKGDRFPICGTTISNTTTNTTNNSTNNASSGSVINLDLNKYPSPGAPGTKADLWKSRWETSPVDRPVNLNNYNDNYEMLRLEIAYNNAPRSTPTTLRTTWKIGSTVMIGKAVFNIPANASSAGFQEWVQKRAAGNGQIDRPGNWTVVVTAEDASTGQVFSQVSANFEIISAPTERGAVATDNNAICRRDIAAYPATCGDGSAPTEILPESEYCYHVFCGNVGNGYWAEICSMPSYNSPQAFEMFYRSFSNTQSVCVGGVCVNATKPYARSPDFVSCSDDSLLVPNPNPAKVQVDINPKFPYHQNVVFYCNATGFMPTRYDWIFGDGTQLLNSDTAEVFHSYPGSGTFTASCTARNDQKSFTASKTVTLNTLMPVEQDRYYDTFINVTKVSDLTYDLSCTSVGLPSGYAWSITGPNDYSLSGHNISGRYTFPRPGNYTLSCEMEGNHDQRWSYWFYNNQKYPDSTTQYQLYYSSRSVTIDTSQAAAVNNATPVNDEGKESGLFLVKAVVNGRVLDSSREVILQPGQQLNGSMEVFHSSNWPTTVSTPLVSTPTWGNHQTSFKYHGNASGSAYKNLTFTVNVPTTPGTYYYVAAYRAEVDAGDVASMTNWARTGGEVYNDGNDLADFTPAMIDEANTNGRTLARILHDNGYQNKYVPATAIKVIVPPPGEANLFVHEDLSADHNVILQCDTPFFAEEYTWTFGDGKTEVKKWNESGGTFWNRMHHTYLRSGTYTITCSAKNSSWPVATDSITVDIQTDASEEEIAATLPAGTHTYYNPYVFRLVNERINGTVFRIGGYSLGIPHDANGNGQSGYWLYSLPFQSSISSTHSNIVTVMFPEPRNYTFFADPGINWGELDPSANRWGQWYRGCSNPRTTCYNSYGGGVVQVPRINDRTEFGILVKKISGRTYNISCQSYITDQGGSGWMIVENQWGTPLSFTGNKWFNYTFPADGNYQIECRQEVGYGYQRYDRTISVTTDDDPGAISILKLHSGHIYDRDISPWGTIVDVYPGEKINGSVTVQWDSSWPTNINSPLIMTPSWGNHQTSFTTHGSAIGSGTRTIPIDLTAPTASGTYYIIFAYRAEIDGGDVASMTNWAYGSEVWNDGNDVASWNSATLEGVWDRGRVQGQMLTSSGMRSTYVPATMIEVRVR